MSKAIRIHETGGPEVLKWEDITVGAPGPREVRVRHRAVGLNYTDIYFRIGIYTVPYPAVLGFEGSGVENDEPEEPASASWPHAA